MTYRCSPLGVYIDQGGVGRLKAVGKSACKLQTIHLVHIRRHGAYGGLPEEHFLLIRGIEGFDGIRSIRRCRLSWQPASNAVWAVKLEGDGIDEAFTPAIELRASRGDVQTHRPRRPLGGLVLVLGYIILVLGTRHAFA